ncbi:hypothetical protein LIER_12241 [Lithospermum erythrorhizon]|uniref:Uncharacterized protein n=1 Tax=Lithospermum erythrorhizon TaxID=34254 RepID=A0AAV3PSH2_LITER
MIAPRMIGDKGAGHASLVFVPRLASPATLGDKESTCRCKATMASVGGAGDTASCTVASWRFCCPAMGSFPLRTTGVWLRWSLRRAVRKYYARLRVYCGRFGKTGTQSVLRGGAMTFNESRKKEYNWLTISQG